MNKINYAIFAGFSLFSFYLIWKQRDKKKKNNFEKEISELKNAIDFAAGKTSQ